MASGPVYRIPQCDNGYVNGITFTRRSALLTGLSSLITLPARAQSSAAKPHSMLVPLPDTKVKLFDPTDGFGAIKSIRVFTDASVVKRGHQWWMIGGGFDVRKGNIVL